MNNYQEFINFLFQCEELWKSPDEELHPTYRLFIYQDTSLNDLEKVCL